MFKPVSNKVAFPKMEEEVLAFWEKDGTFAKSLKKNDGRERYTFYDGPPFATGLPHYGHLLAGAVVVAVDEWRGRIQIPVFQALKSRCTVCSACTVVLIACGSRPADIRECSDDFVNGQCLVAVSHCGSSQSYD